MHENRRRTFRRACIVLCFGLCAAGADAAVLYTDLGAGETYQSFGDSTAPQYMGAPFVATASGTLLDLLLPIAESGPGTVDIGLYTSSGGEPGSALETWTGISIYDSFAGQAPLDDLASVAHPALTLGSTYWVVVNSTTEDLAWDGDSTGILGGTWFGSAVNELGQAAPDDYASALQVDGISNGAPEPGTIGLIGLGLLGVAVRRIRPVV